MRDTLSGRNVSYDDLGELEKAELKVMVRSYLQGKIALDEVQVRFRHPCENSHCVSTPRRARDTTTNSHFDAFVWGGVRSPT
jgi:hypothetical protein